MKVSGMMTRDVKSCALNETLNSAARIMWEHDCGCVPVVDAGGRLVGIVTDRDLSIAAYTQGLPLSAIPVERAMSARVIACAPTDSAATAHRLMRQHEIHRLPVVDSAGAVIGILSLSDLVNGRPANANEVKHNANEIFETVAAIRRRRPSAIVATAKPDSTAKRPRTNRRKAARE